MNRAIYPLKTMRITQGYVGNTSHLPHTTGKPKDYPIDDGEKDYGRGNFYCPCNEMKIVKIYGVGNDGVNTIWLQSTDLVDFADGTKAILTILVMHPDDDDSRKLKVGQTFKRYEMIFREGKDGATAYHFHISAGKGEIKGNGWVQNSYSKWVLTTTHGAFKPEQIFFIDDNFTNVVNDKGLKFKKLPKNPYDFTEEKKYITLGDKGDSVKWVQFELVRLGFDIGKGVNGEPDNVDGRCGQATTNAIKVFQRTHKDLNGRQLAVDGKAGPLTRGAMKNA